MVLVDSDGFLNCPAEIAARKVQVHCFDRWESNDSAGERKRAAKRESGLLSGQKQKQVNHEIRKSLSARLALAESSQPRLITKQAARKARIQTLESVLRMIPKGKPGRKAK